MGCTRFGLSLRPLVSFPVLLAPYAYGGFWCDVSCREGITLTS